MKYQNISRICHEPHLTLRPLTSKREFMFYLFSSAENKTNTFTFSCKIHKEYQIIHYSEMQVSHWHSTTVMLLQIVCTNKTRMRLAHWHTLPISHLQHISNIFHTSTIHHRNISMLLTNNRISIQHIKYANNFFKNRTMHKYS